MHVQDVVFPWLLVFFVKRIAGFQCYAIQKDQDQEKYEKHMFVKQ